MFLLPLLTALLLEEGEKRTEKRKAWMKRIISSELHFVPMCSPSIPLCVVFFPGVITPIYPLGMFPAASALCIAEQSSYHCGLFCKGTSALWVVLFMHAVIGCQFVALLFFCVFVFSLSPLFKRPFFPPSSIKSREMTSLSYPFLFYMISRANYLCSCSLSVCQMREIDARKRKLLSQF